LSLAFVFLPAFLRVASKLDTHLGFLCPRRSQVAPFHSLGKLFFNRRSIRVNPSKPPPTKLPLVQGIDVIISYLPVGPEALPLLDAERDDAVAIQVGGAFHVEV